MVIDCDQLVLQFSPCDGFIVVSCKVRYLYILMSSFHGLIVVVLSPLISIVSANYFRKFSLIFAYTSIMCT